MKYNNIIEQLSKLGLTRNEASIYTLLTEVGSEKSKNTAYYVAKKLELPRATVYLHLEKLLSDKLVSLYKINGINHYLAENPQRISRELIEKKNIFDGILPALEELRSNKSIHSTVRTYTGDSGVKIVLDDIFSNDNVRKVKEILCISNPLLSKILPRGFPEKLDGLKKIYNIHTKMILVRQDNSDLDNVYKTDSHRETRVMPRNYYFDGSLYIYNEKVAFIALSEDELYSVIIESKTITKMIRAFFLCTWDLLDSNLK